MSEPGATSDGGGKAAAPRRLVRRRRSKWPMRIVLLAIAGTLVALAPRWLKKKPIVVDAVRVERGLVRDEVSSASAGEVVAEHHATVRAEIAGRVVAVKHRRGERVKRGDLIVAVDATDLDARIAQSQAALEAQRAQVAQAEAHAQAAAHAADRARALAERGAGTTQLSDDSAAAKREAEAALGAARGLLAQSEAALKVARVARTKADLIAPFDGLLVEVYPEQGDELQPAAPVFELIDDSRLHVEATIDEADVGRVRVGQPAALRLDALPGRSITGVVSRVSPTVRRDEKGARTLKIEVEVSDLDAAKAAGLRAGMSANVDVRVAEKPDVPSLPTNVIVGRGTRRTVFVVDNGVARVREIQVGLSSWERSEILGGVSVGDAVIATLNTPGLADGVPVTLGATH